MSSFPTNQVDLSGVDASDETPGVHESLDHPRARALLQPRRLRWNAGQLCALTSTVSTVFRAELDRIARYEHDGRWWARLALTDGVELWLLTWLPGQGTEPHDHGGAAGSFTVVHGELHEDYRYPQRPVRARTRRAGDALGFGAGRAHQVRNLSQAPAASVHAYSPPLVPTREYASLADIPATIPPLPTGAVRLRESEPA